jgi:hypothetical protein
MTVTQGGGTVFATIAPEGFGAFPFQGHLQELGEKPGQGATTLLACGTEAGSSSYAEGVSAQVKVNQRDPSKATFKASSTRRAPTDRGTRRLQAPERLEGQGQYRHGWRAPDILH